MNTYIKVKVIDIQQALFAAYDLRNAMTSRDKKRPTENESMGECLDEVITFLEALEGEAAIRADDKAEIQNPET